MNEIKNLQKLEGIVNSDDQVLMEMAAKEHRKYSNITFKILQADAKEVIIEITQGRSAAGNYQTAKRLIAIVHETYDRFFKGKKIHVRPNPYQQPDCNQVTPEWVAMQMSKSGLKLKTIADETGMDYGNLSEITSGKLAMSQPMKVALWYYFLSKK